MARYDINVAQNNSPQVSAPETRSADIALEVSGLAKTFGSKTRPIKAVQGVSFTAARGQVTTLLGTNGAGKSTTLACCQGLQKPDAGKISLLGQNPWGASATLRSRVGVMLQDGGLPPAQTPLRLLKHVAGLFQNPRPLPELMEQLNIAHLARRSIRRLSGGEKQRVSLAMAMLGRPEVLFLDEPSAGLDPQSRLLVFDILKELTSGGAAVILTTHLLEEAERLSDYILIMDRGRVVKQSSVSDLLDADATASLTLTLPEAVDLTHIFDQAGVPLTPTSTRPGTWIIDDVTNPQQLRELASALEKADLMPASMHLGRRSLEDIFLEVASQTTEGEA